MSRIITPVFTVLFSLVSFGIQAQCPIVIDSIVTVSTFCVGDCEGEATVSVSGPGNLTYQWYDGNQVPMTGATGPTLSGVCPGDFIVDITTDQGGGGSVTLFEETFDAAPNWTFTPTGNNGADANYWVVSDAEGGVEPPGCGLANNGDATMHITATLLPGLGAAYNAGMQGGCPDVTCPEAHIRAESPMINTVGSSNLTLEFDFISVGDALNDNASVWYNDGTGWSQLSASIKSLVCVGTGQGEWTVYSETLPASCENIANLQVGINWTNNEDGLGSDPSIAINDLTVTAVAPSGPCTTTSDPITIGAPNPLFILTQQSTSTSCETVSNGTITLSGGGGNAPYNFSIDGGSMFSNTSGLFSGLAAGFYTIGLQDANGCIFEGDSIAVGVAALATPSITGDFEFCEGDSVTLVASGGFAGYLWMPSGAIGQAFVASNPSVTTVVGVDTAGCESESNPVTIIEHPTPLPVITGDTVICESEESMLNAGSGYVTYEWSPNGETTQTVDVSAGSYSVTVVDFYGCTGTSQEIAVNEIQFTVVNIQSSGDSIFVDPTIGTGFQWHLDGFPIPGGVNSHFIAEMSGNYTLYYIDAFGCAHFTNGLDHIYISVEETNLDFNVFPNPVSDWLSVNLKLNNGFNLLGLKIIDATGRNLKVDQFGTDCGLRLNVSNLDPGVYVLNIPTDEGIHSRAFLVNRH